MTDQSSFGTYQLSTDMCKPAGAAHRKASSGSADDSHLQGSGWKPDDKQPSLTLMTNADLKNALVPISGLVFEGGFPAFQVSVTSDGKTWIAKTTVDEQEVFPAVPSGHHEVKFNSCSVAAAVKIVLQKKHTKGGLRVDLLLGGVRLPKSQPLKLDGKVSLQFGVKNECLLLFSHQPIALCSSGIRDKTALKERASGCARIAASSVAHCVRLEARSCIQRQVHS